MIRRFFRLAVVLTVVAIAAFVVWYVESGTSPSGGAANLQLASHALLICIVALITAGVAWYSALRPPHAKS
jgi:cytosine/uracil/thiamine/allantoin permease